MTEPTDRSAVRQRARERAQRMGYRVRPDVDENATQVAPEPLPTTRPAALRQLLAQNRLTPGQVVQARALFAAARQHVIDHPEGD